MAAWLRPLCRINILGAGRVFDARIVLEFTCTRLETPWIWRDVPVKVCESWTKVGHRHKVKHLHHLVWLACSEQAQAGSEMSAIECLELYEQRARNMSQLADEMTPRSLSQWHAQALRATRLTLVSGSGHVSMRLSLSWDANVTFHQYIGVWPGTLFLVTCRSSSPRPIAEMFCAEGRSSSCFVAAAQDACSQAQQPRRLSPKQLFPF